jgi:hypothetical protein
MRKEKARIFESRRGTKRRKKGEKMHFVSWKVFSFLAIFSLLLFICTSKMISKA